MARLFGTDGVRGVANVDLTCELSYRLGQAAASFMGKTIVVGKDTRKSGDMLEAAALRAQAAMRCLRALFLRRLWRCWFANCMPMAAS